MERFILEKDVVIFYVTASSFPEGIMAAHEKIHKLVSGNEHRRFYAVSRPENKNGIVYKAGAEELIEKEGKKYGCETMTIKKGNYLSLYISNYSQNNTSISDAFGKILREPGLDPEGYCVEQYIGKADVRCMVRLKD